MAVKRVTSSKRDREKAKQSKREEKQKRKEERLSSGSRSFEEMLAYVDENGILHSTPEGVKPKEEIDASEIEISIPKKGEAEEVLPLNGRIEHFNVSRGYGFIKDLGRYVPDDFSGECFAVCFPGRRRDGFVLITGGAYTGIAGMINTAKRLWDAPVLSVVGCFAYTNRLGKQTVQQSHIAKSADELSGLRTGSIYTCHNTGRKGYEIMKDILGDRLQYLRAGEELNF